MRLPTIRQFRALLAVAESGSVSVAARSLGLTQPAVSQQLRELERTLAVRLFERANGKSILTTSGRSLIEPARRAQAAAEDAIAVAAETRLGDLGPVRIGTGVTGCIHLLPSVFSAVKASMPGLSITVTIGDTADLIPPLLAGELDIGLMTLPTTTNPALASVRLFSEPLVALLPAAVAGTAKSITAAQLADLPLIFYKAGGNTRTITDGWFRMAGVAPQPVMELGNFEAIKVMVGASLGAAVVPHLALSTMPPGTVARSLRPSLSREVGYVLRREKVMDRGLRRFIQALESYPPP